MNPAAETVAVLGAGSTMGRPIAANIARAGIAVRAWNRSPEKAEPLRADGATLCDSAAEATAGATIVLTMLSDAGAVLATIEDALADGARPALWLQMSTVGIEGTERCAQLAERHGIAFADAPVLGTKQPAENGELVILGSGPEDARERLDPILDAIGKRTMWLGAAGAGSALKLAINGWILGVVETAAETLALAEGIGVDPRTVLDAVSGGPLDLPYLQLKGRAMIERSFEPSFRLTLAAKDARLVVDATERYGLDLPVLRAIASRLSEGAERHGDADMAATFLTSAPDERTSQAEA